MAMFPVFMTGLIVGILLSYTWYIYRKETPSEMKFKLQEAEIMRYKNDNDKLYELTNKYCEKIKALEAELKEYKK